MGTRERKIRILLADDHLIVRMGMASILSFEEDMEVVGEAGNGLDAVKMAAELSPDVVLMDLQMPELGGADATAKIHEANPNIKILILTTFGTSADLKKAMDGGAAGALIKRDLQSIPELSPRQLEILNLIAKGFSNSEIAGIAGISLETVKDHIKKILMRLGVSSRTEAASLAINLNLIGG